MKRKSDHTIFVAQTDAAQAQLLRAAMESLGISVHVLDPQQKLEAQIENWRYARHDKTVLVADLSAFVAQGCPPDEMLSRLASRFPDLRVVTTLADRLTVTTQDATWANSLGAAGLFPRVSALRIEETLLPILAAIIDDPGAQFDVERIASMFRALGADIDEAPVFVAAQKLLAKRGTGLADLKKLVATIRSPGGFDIQDRTYRMTTYPDCFVGREAVDALVRITGRSRPTAIAIGRLLHSIGEFYHVAGEQDFEDDDFYYRLGSSTPRIGLLDLQQVIRAAPGANGFVVRDRSYLGKRFPKCFVGSEATEWLKKQYDLTLPGVIALGQTLLRLHVIRHVVDEHDFIDRAFYYRFT